MMLVLLSLLLPHVLHVSMVHARSPVTRSDDPSPFQTALEQLTAKFNALQARMDSQDNTIAEQRQEIADLKAASSRKVAFSAYNTEGKHYTAADDGVIPFEHVISNVGNAYNTVTFAFTAPYDGIYYFGVDLNVSADYELVQVRKGTQELFIADKDDSISTSVSNSAVVSLKAGDVITVHHYSRDNGFVEGGRDSIFTGFLIG